MTNLVEIDQGGKGVFTKHDELDLCYSLPELCPVATQSEKNLKQYAFHAVNMELGSYTIRYSLVGDFGEKLVCVEFPVNVVKGIW